MGLHTIALLKPCGDLDLATHPPSTQFYGISLIVAERVNVLT